MSEFIQCLNLEQEKLTDTALSQNMPSNPAFAILPRDVPELKQSTFIRTGHGDSISQAEFNRLEVLVKLMEARIPQVENCRLGSETFQSRADVMLFVETQVPSNSFYLWSLHVYRRHNTTPMGNIPSLAPRDMLIFLDAKVHGILC